MGAAFHWAEVVSGLGVITIRGTSAPQEKKTLRRGMTDFFYWLIARALIRGFGWSKNQVHISKTRFRRCDQSWRQYRLYWGVRHAFLTHFDPKKPFMHPDDFPSPPDIPMTHPDHPQSPVDLGDIPFPLFWPKTTILGQNVPSRRRRVTWL